MRQTTAVLLSSNRPGRYHLESDHMLRMEGWHAQEQNDGSDKASRHYPGAHHTIQYFPHHICFRG